MTRRIVTRRVEDQGGVDPSYPAEEQEDVESLVDAEHPAGDVSAVKRRTSSRGS